MSGVGKPGYKETAVGWIPVEWTLGKLGDFVAALQAGVSVNANETETGCLDGQVGVLKTSAVLGGKFFAHQHKVVVPEDVDRVASPVLADRVVISRMNTPALVGESGYVPTAQPHLFLPDRLWQTVPSDCPHSQRWLSYWLQLPAIKSLIASGATGTSNSMKNISKDVLLTLPTPHTPFPEQQKIAAILTAVDDKLDLIARQISATQTLKQGLMQTLFTRGAGTQTASRWPTVLLHQVAEVRTGVAKGKKGLREPVTLPYLRVANVQDGHIDLREVKDIEVEASQVERYALKAGDMLMTEGGDFDKLGRGDVWKGQISPCLHQNHVYAVRPDASKLNSYYLAAFASSEQGRQYFLACAKRTTNLASINSSQLKAFPVLLPPLEVQQYIADANDAANSKIATLTTQQTHYQSLKRGLMQKLLTGQWRVRVDAAALAPVNEEAPA